MTDAALAPGSTELLDPTEQAPRVLLAEDDMELRTLLHEVLEQEGYEVIVAEDGFDLLDRVGDTWLSEAVYDLILSDVRMPGCTGIEAMEALRSKDAITPVLFMTAFSSQETRDQAAQLGATVIDKPFDLDELLDCMRARLPVWFA